MTTVQQSFNILVFIYMVSRENGPSWYKGESAKRPGQRPPVMPVTELRCHHISSIPNSLLIKNYFNLFDNFSPIIFQHRKFIISVYVRFIINRSF